MFIILWFKRLSALELNLNVFFCLTFQMLIEVIAFERLIQKLGWRVIIIIPMEFLRSAILLTQLQLNYLTETNFNNLKDRCWTLRPASDVEFWTDASKCLLDSSKVEISSSLIQKTSLIKRILMISFLLWNSIIDNDVTNWWTCHTS